MARPKRQRSEVASIELPPTTRRRRSSVIEPEATAVGIGGKSDSHKKSTNSTGNGTVSTMKIEDSGASSSNDVPTSKKNASVAADGLDAAKIPRSTRSQPSTSSTATDTASTGQNIDDLGNDHADDGDGNDDGASRKTSQIDANSRVEASSTGVRSVDHTDKSVATTKRTTNATQFRENDTPSTSTSKSVHSTASITTTNSSTVAAGSTTTLPKSTTTAASSTTTTRRSSNLSVTNSDVVTERIETSAATVGDIKKKNIDMENTAEASSLPSTANQQIVAEHTTLNTAEPGNTKLKRDDVASLLQHRKMLLQRVRQCRKVTEQRLSTAAVSSIDEEKETVLFTDTMKQVLSLARKQARLEQQREGNNNKNTGTNNNNDSAGKIVTTTVSLRRGNSVGKRMNAAISTLTGTNANNNNQQQQQQQHHESSSMGPLKLATLMNTKNDGIPSLNPLSEGAVGTVELSGPTLPTTKANPYKNSSTTNIGGGVQPAKTANRRSDSSMSRTIPKKSQNIRGGNDNISAHHQHRSTVNHGNNQQLYSSSIHHHHQQQQQNRVVCPETMVLRNRRDEIRSKLSTILKQRQQPKLDKTISLSERRNSMVSHVSSSSLSPRSTVISSKPVSASLHRSSRHGSEKNNQKIISSPLPLPIWENPDGPPNLPPRRKTHWDTVLEEMRWMATDFIEEQKWKIASSRVLSMQASAFVLSSKKQHQTKNSHVKQSISHAIDQAYTPDIEKVDEQSRDIGSKDSRSAGKFHLSVLSNFQLMTPDDAISARNIAKKLSDIIADMVNLNNLSIGSSTSNVSTMHPISESNAMMGDLDTTDPTLDFSKQKAELIERVSTHIDNILKLTTEQVLNINEVTNAASEKCNKNEIQPTIEQVRTLQMIEDRWIRIGIGSVVHGPRSSGKTIVACNLLYRNRSHGPQLLVCSSASLTRWMHELGNFNGLHIKKWNNSDSCTTSMQRIGANDILVCQHASMLNLPLDDLCKFSAVILDCRYANQSSQHHLRGSRTEQSICVPYDLSSQVWWKKIVDVLSTCDISRRLLVDSFDSDNNLTYLRGLTSKEFLAVTALRTAFLLGPKNFVTPIYPIEKAILGWARQRTKRDATNGSKFSQVSALLSKICEACHCKAGLDVDNLDWVGKIVSWDVRYCTMTRTQRLAYNRACQQSRLVLSQELDNQNERVFEDIAASLLLLRRQCIHSNIEEMLNHTTSSDTDALYNKIENCPHQQLCGNNAAQPNIEMAYKILAGSGKLRQLVSILHDSEGYKLFGYTDNKNVGLKKDSDRRPSDQIEQKKVVIIASLPEIRLLVSCLLHSLGVNHEILMTCTVNPGCNEGSLSWSNVQALLSRFNCRGESNSNVVITSLSAIEGDQVGLGIEAADSVLLLDEDWSGQEERLLLTVLSRCFQKRKSVGSKGVHVIRLVSARTCEEKFIGCNIHDNLDYADTLTGWIKRHHADDVSTSSTHINSIGASVKAANGQRDPTSFLYCFPGQNILRHRNVALNDVLRPNMSVSHFNSYSTNHRFLPIVSDNESTNIERMITSCLVREESLTRGHIDQIEVLSAKSINEIQLWHEVNDCLPPPPLRDFVRRQYETMALYDNGSTFSLANVTLAAKGVTRVVEASDHIERETRPTLVRSPIDAAFSVLLYKRDAANAVQDLATDGAVSHRGNRYAASFSTSSDGSLRHDGNQGVEALVYFPPIFPRLRECIDTAISDHRQTSQNDAVDGSTNIAGHNGGHKFGTESAMDLDADFGLAGAGVFPSFHDSVTAAAGIVSHSGSSYVESTDVLNDWLSSISPINAEEYQTILHHGVSNNSLKSAILMVSRKRQRGQSNTSYQARYGTGVWSGISTSISDMTLTVDVNGVNKKGKKAVSAFNRLPLADTPQHNRPTTFAFQRKDDYRHRLLMTLRQSSTSSGSTIFDAPIFRVAAVRIRERISTRLQRQNWITSPTRVNDKSCSGLPIIFRTVHEGDSNRTSIVSRSSKSATMVDEQINDMARQQLIAFQKSHSEPRRVDFGPFQLGFVSSIPGMTSVTFPRPRIGITLPMGVKMSIVSKEQTSVQWSNEKDSILMHAINRFGTNWIIASLLLKSFFGVSNSHAESNFYNFPCAPRNCRDRWRMLTRDEGTDKRYTSIISNLDIQLGGDSGRRMLVSSQNGSESKKAIVDTFLLVPSSVDSMVPARAETATSTQDESSSPTKRKSSRRTFAAFQLGLAKQQNMTGPITGVAAVVAPCHPSHEATVQMSTMAVNGRTDMWPLQILDGAERLRSAAAVSSAAIESTSSSGQSIPSRRPVNISTRVHSGTNTGRSRAPVAPNHRSHSTTTSQIPLQRTTSSNTTSASQRPTSQHAYPTNHVTASKQRFVPPVPSTKVISTPKVQVSTSNPMQPPHTVTSQPSKSINTTNTATSVPSAISTNPPVTSTNNEAVVSTQPSRYTNGSISSDKPEPSKTVSVPSQGAEIMKATATSAKQAHPSNRNETDVTTTGPSTPSSSVPTIDVSSTTVTSNVSEQVVATGSATKKTIHTNVVVPAITIPVAAVPAEYSISAVPTTDVPVVPDAVPPTPSVLQESQKQ